VLDGVPFAVKDHVDVFATASGHGTTFLAAA
jgi:Asp-tRNA(Asn)/Glu-tRNA(Gln) amidotransferase A subunit family amidase